MAYSLFISHVYEDMRARDSVGRWARDGLLGAGVVVTGESEDHRPWGHGAIRKHISPKLRGASAVVVLVGNDTHNHHWVAYEAQHALSDGKKVVVARIPGTTGAVPEVLRSLREIPLDPTALRRALGR